MTEKAAQRFEEMKATLINGFAHAFNLRRVTGIWNDNKSDDEIIKEIMPIDEIQILSQLVAVGELLPGVYTFHEVEDKHINEAYRLIKASANLLREDYPVTTMDVASESAAQSALQGKVTGISITSAGSGYPNPPNISMKPPSRQWWGKAKTAKASP